MLHSLLAVKKNNASKKWSNWRDKLCGNATTMDGSVFLVVLLAAIILAVKKKNPSKSRGITNATI